MWGFVPGPHRNSKCMCRHVAQAEGKERKPKWIIDFFKEMKVKTELVEEPAVVVKPVKPAVKLEKPAVKPAVVVKPEKPDEPNADEPTGDDKEDVGDDDDDSGYDDNTTEPRKSKGEPKAEPKTSNRFLGKRRPVIEGQ